MFDTILKLLKSLEQRLELLERSRGSDEAFINATYLNSWVSYGGGNKPAGYYKGLDGVVHLQGLVKSGTIGQPIFRLPTGYIPTHALIFVIISNDAVAKLEVQSDGDVVALTGNNTYVSLEGVSFRV